jgi:integrase
VSGSISRRVAKDGTVRFVARWRGPGGGNPKQQTFDRKAEAERFLSSLSHAKATGAYIDPASGRTTIREYGERWRAMQVHHRPRTAEHVAISLRVHLYPVLGDRQLAHVTRSDVQAWYAGLHTRLAPSTARVAYSYLVSIYKAAVLDRIVAASPCVGIKFTRQERPQIAPLTPEQVSAIRRALPPRYRALITLMEFTGARPSEAFGLTPDRVDFLRGRVRIDRQLANYDEFGRVAFGPPKTKSSAREISVPPRVTQELAGHIAEFGTHPAGLIFTRQSGAPISFKRFYKAGGVWQRALVEAGLLEFGAQDARGRRRLRWTLHDLRHYHASLLIRRGANVKDVQARLGHASAMETLDTYGHLFPDDDDRIRGLLTDLADEDRDAVRA